MFRYISIRILRAIATLWIVVTIVFFGMRFTSDPIELMLGDNAQPEDIAKLRAAYGLDDSPITQYIRYVEQVASGNFGSSLTERRPVTTVIREKFPATLELASWSILLALCLGIPAGVLAAVRRNSFVDRAVIGFSFIGQAVPGFFIAILLIYLFTLYFGILPSSGRGSWKHLILPVTALGWGSLATVARITRVAVLEVLNADYVRTARSKGLHERRILAAHVLRNAMVPVLTMLGFLLGASVAGAITVEKVFAWPGMGRVLEGAVLGRDFPLIQALVLMIATSVVLVNLAVDLAYGIIDPRIGH